MKCSLLALSGYLDDELDAGRRAEVEAHLVGCERCRKGLEYLREETDRFGALGRVHVPDSAIHAFMEQLGLVGSDDVLPRRPARPPRPASRDARPWMRGGDTGQALPWAPRRQAEAPPDSNQPSLPFTDSVAPLALSPLSSSPDGPSGGSELHLNGRSAAAMTPAPVERPAPPPPGAADGSASDARPLGGVALEGVSTWRLDPPTIAASAAVGAAAPVGEPAPRHDAVTSPQPSPGRREGWSVSVAPQSAAPPAAPTPAPPLAPPLPPTFTPPPPPTFAPAPPQPPPALPEPRPLAQLWPAPSALPTPVTWPDEDDDPWSWAPLDAEPSVAELPAAPEAAEPAAPGMDSGEVDPPYPEQDATPDPLIDPLIARGARPPQLLRPTLISRLRDQVALRLALMRGTDGDDVAPPTGGPQTLESIGPVVAAMRARMDPPVVDQRPGPSGGAISPWDLDRAGAASWPEVPFHPTTAEELPRSPGPSRVLELDRGPRAPGRHARRLGERHGSPGGPAATGSGLLADLPDRMRRFTDRPRRVWIAIAGLAVLVVMVGLLVSHLGAPATPGLASTGTASRVATSLAPKSQPVTAVRPSASTAPTVTATPAPTPVPTAAVVAQTYGGGGTGWQLQDVRCCDVQAGTGYTRIVFDLGGASGADPTASVSFPTSTTMVVAFPGVDAPASLTASGSGGLVTGVTRESGSELTFRLTLSTAASVKGWAYFGGADAESSAPLHLYFDVN